MTGKETKDEFVISTIPANELIKRISELMDTKFTEWVAKLKNENMPSVDTWLSITDFCCQYKLSATTLWRMVKDGKVERRTRSDKLKLYRWKNKKYLK